MGDGFNLYGDGWVSQLGDFHERRSWEITLKEL
jgi:hypothetical protein